MEFGRMPKVAQRNFGGANWQQQGKISAYSFVYGAHTPFAYIQKYFYGVATLANPPLAAFGLHYLAALCAPLLRFCCLAIVSCCCG